MADLETSHATLDHTGLTGVGGGGGGLTQAYVGYNTVGASAENVALQVQYMTKITLAAAGLLTNVEIHCKSDGANVPYIHYAVCDDNAGTIGNLIAINVSQDNAAYMNTTYRWLGAAMGVWLPAGDYWIGFMAEGAASINFEVHYDTGGSDRKIASSGGNWLMDGSMASQTNTTRKYSIRGNFVS